jgi:hypothetical protein
MVSVIGLLAVAAIPTVTGVGQAISAQKKANAAQKEKVEFQLTTAFYADDAPEDEEFCVLKDGKVGT